jgi:hypothetical protein
VRGRGYSSGLLAATVLLAMAASVSAAEPLLRPDPIPPRARGPGELSAAKARKRARIAEKKRLKAGIAGSKLSRKAARGGL